MVLVDTSVWIRVLANRAPYAGEADRLLGRRAVAGHELVYGELLVGDKGGRKHFLDDYAQIRYATRVPHADVVELIRARKLNGSGIGWIDAHLLASTLVDGLLLWTADADLCVVASALGVAYSIAA